MKHFLQFLLCLIYISSSFLTTVYAGPAWPAEPEIQAEAGIVIDADSGAVLGGKEYDSPYPPASITKLLTALLVMEHCSLNETVTFSASAVNDVEPDAGNKLNVAAGDELSVEDCMYSMLLHSCNQAANALAEHVAGTQADFVQMMNDKAAALGCKNSHFDNPSGLNGDTQYVTARDMAVIAKSAFADPDIVRISGAQSHKIPPLTNSPDGLTIMAENKLIRNADNPSSQYYSPFIKGGKTGYLLKAGNTLAVYAEQDGKRLVSVILKGKPGQYYLDGKELLEFGFAHFTNFCIADNEPSYTQGEAPVAVGNESLLPADLEIDPSGMATLPEGAQFSELEHSLSMDFPLEHPERSLAFIRYTYGGRNVGGAYLLKKEVQEPIIAADMNPEKAEKEEKKEEKKERKGIPSGIGFVVVLVAAVAAVCGGLAYFFASRKKEDWERALRREQRLRRLREEGFAQDEFERLLKQRLGSRGKRKRK